MCSKSPSSDLTPVRSCRCRNQGPGVMLALMWADVQRGVLVSGGQDMGDTQAPVVTLCRAAQEPRNGAWTLSA